MRTLTTVIFLALSLSGCAQWKQMTPAERKVVIGTGIASAVVAGAIASQSDDPSIVAEPVRHKTRGRVLCAGQYCK